MHTYTRNLYKRERVLHGRNVIRSWKKNTENQGLNIYIYTYIEITQSHSNNV